jgi:hypothetical protein
VRSGVGGTVVPVAARASRKRRTTTVLLICALISALFLANGLLFAFKRFGFGIAGVVDAITAVLLSCCRLRAAWRQLRHPPDAHPSLPPPDEYRQLRRPGRRGP